MVNPTGNPTVNTTQSAADLSGSNVGDLSQRDVANTIYNITASLGEATKLLQNDVDRLHLRVDVIERLEAQHSNERQALTRLITQLATESKTVSDVHDLLTHQIEGDAAERGYRRRYLDTMLSGLVALAVINVGFSIYRVLRRPAGGAAI
jgi:hypothetical protein